MEDLFQNRGLWHDSWRRLKRSRNARLGLVIVLLIVGIAVLAPWLAPYDPLHGMIEDNNLPPFWWGNFGLSVKEDRPGRETMESGAALPAPSDEGIQETTVITFDQGPADEERQPHRRYLFGSDDVGRDVFSRVLHGARYSLVIGLISVIIGLFIGTPLGLAAGYWGGRIDSLIMRSMDILMAIPYVLLAILIVAILGPGIWNAMIAIGIVQVPQFARVVRGSVLAVRELEYVQAAKVLGASDSRIIRIHILRNSLSPLIVQTSLTFASAILSAAALGFLGLGAQPPAPEWGAMLADGRKLLLSSPWAAVFPGAAIVFFVLGFNLLGDGIRDALEVRMKH